MNSKTNEILYDIIHIASQAILADDEAIKSQAMADIVDALASAIPSDRVAARGGARALPNAANRTKILSINGYSTVIAKADVCGREFYAEADYEIMTDKRHDESEGFVASVFEDKEDGIYQLARIEFEEDCGSNAVMRMLRGVLLGISSHYGHSRRKRANKRNRLALTADRELAATVARQMDDDDLAQQIENA